MLGKVKLERCTHKIGGLQGPFMMTSAQIVRFRDVALGGLL
jgi:hypothetical protein